MAVISRVALIKGGWVVGVWEGGNRALVRKKTPRGTHSCNHMPNKPLHLSQTTTEDEANM